VARCGILRKLSRPADLGLTPKPASVLTRRADSLICAERLEFRFGANVFDEGLRAIIGRKAEEVPRLVLPAPQQGKFAAVETRFADLARLCISIGVVRPVGKSNSKTTRRDPQRGHFNRPSSIDIGKAAPLVQISVSRSSE
jgi:hypothetical protein